MRKTTAALSALALSAIALTGCSAPGATFDGATCDRSSSAALQMQVKVTGGIGAAQATTTSPVRTSKVSYADLIVGDGPAITEPDQFAILNRTLLNGKTGDTLHSTISFWSPDTASQEFAGIGEALECATEGSRVVVAIPASTLPEGAPQQLGLSDNDSLIAVYDVRATMLPRAEGRDVFNDASGLPTVVRGSDGRPGVIIPDSAAPEKAVVQTLIEGDGDKVGESIAVIQSTSVSWNSRKMVNTTWDSAVTDTSGLPEQAQKAVADATIGSQLMVVVPDDSGDADAYVIDVLGVIPSELTQG